MTTLTKIEMTRIIKKTFITKEALKMRSMMIKEALTKRKTKLIIRSLMQARLKMRRLI